MKLLAILLCMAADQMAAYRLDARTWAWFAPLSRRLAGHLGALPSPLVTLVVIAVPWLVAWLALHLLFEAWFVFGWLASVVVLFACLGPHDLRGAVTEYLQALASGGREAAEPLGRRIATRGEEGDGSLRGMLGALLVNASDRLFAVAFWFVVMGPLGALLYRLAAEHAYAERAGGRAESGSGADLHAILAWVPVRLLGLCYGLAGSLTHAFDQWDILSTLHLRDNDRVLASAGLGALQYGGGPIIVESADPREALEAAQGLVRRGFAVALIVLALLTLAGWV